MTAQMLIWTTVLRMWQHPDGIFRTHGCPRTQSSVTASSPRAAAASGLRFHTKEGFHTERNTRNPGSLGGEMRMRINRHCKSLSNCTRSSYMRSCKAFDKWRKEAGLSNKTVRDQPREAVIQWAEHLKQIGRAQCTIHNMVAGCCVGLGIPSDKIARHGNALQKTKSLGNTKRSQAARKKASNQDLVHFQSMVGGRRAALGRLTGSDYVFDESGEPCVRFIKDKGGKTQLQRILPTDTDAVKSYFDAVAPDQLLFPKIDNDLDLHGIRAEHARSMYQYYEKIASSPQGREQLRQQLWARYKNPEIGCKAWLIAKASGNNTKARKLEYRFKKEMSEGIYYLHGANRKAAIQRGHPIKLDRLAILATSVFSLSHWRTDVAVKHYLI